MAKKYYDISNILETKAQYMILLGQRANGKSYQAKKTVLEDAYYNDRKFVYLRRYKADIKTKAVESYFEDMPIKEIALTLDTSEVNIKKRLSRARQKLRLELEGKEDF